jgi:hypothetical protein
MKIITAIFIAALAVPVIMICLFITVALGFMVVQLIQDGEYNNKWLGIIAEPATRVRNSLTPEKQKGHTMVTLSFLLVELAGVEPASANPPPSALHA